MPCNPDTLRQVPLFALLDNEETAVLSKEVEVKQFAPRQRRNIFALKINGAGNHFSICR